MDNLISNSKLKWLHTATASIFGQIYFRLTLCSKNFWLGTYNQVSITLPYLKEMQLLRIKVNRLYHEWTENWLIC